MVKSSIFKLCTRKYKIYNNIYIHNLGYVEVNQYQKLYLQLYQLLMMGVNTRNM